MTDLRDIIAQIDLLEPVPPVAAQILALADDPNSSLTEISELIIHDPALTANLLKICNSAFFSLSRRIDSVRDAISLVGLDQIVELVLFNSLSSNFNKELVGYGLGERELWRHAVSSAHVAAMLADRFGASQTKHLIFTAALIKDIGKLILGRFVAFSYEQINILVHSKGQSFNDAEHAIIGMNHEELGALVAKRWNFSEKLIYVMRHHHLSDESARQDLETVLVYLADLICMMMGVCTGADGLSYRFYSDVLNQLSLNGNDLQGIIAEAGKNQQQVEVLLAL
ncbi:MAG: HDOD domain-containing protein [Deltaproteobacteria bacterium]|jgi:putative nucleotidyltransferase with HDIG domain|nr:HDOD domain-containing protein [Deltaproteobacteria bacterium]